MRGVVCMCCTDVRQSRLDKIAAYQLRDKGTETNTSGTAASAKADAEADAWMQQTELVASGTTK